MLTKRREWETIEADEVEQLIPLEVSDPAQENSVPPFRQNTFGRPGGGGEFFFLFFWWASLAFPQWPFLAG